MLLKNIRRKLLKRKLRRLWDSSDLATVKSRIDSAYLKEFNFQKCDSLADYLKKVRRKRIAEGIIEDLIVEKQSEQTISAHCSFCGEDLLMEVDFLYAGKQKDGTMVPNFRERMTCPKCGLNNRLRATYHLMRELFPDLENKKIYITEEATPFFSKLKEKNNDIIGSEYFENNVNKKVFIEALNREVNNEDLNNLSFNDKEFDLAVSCEVLEHIPDYRKALQEIHRSLKDDGVFIFSAPFVATSDRTIIRAKIENGEVKNILPAEYHGDPVNPEGGCLCFYHFGWDLIEELKNAGFKESGAYLYNSPQDGYLGAGLILCAVK